MSQTDKNTIDLNKFKSPAAKIITGRPFGQHVREKSFIDRIDLEQDEIYVVIPEGLKMIGPSFFEELFQTVIRRLGKERFLEKVKFVNNGGYDFIAPLDEAVDRVLRTKSALDI